MYQHILVPIDGSATSGKGLDEAIRLAQLTGGRLRLVHVTDELSLALAMDAYAGAVGSWRDELRTEGLKLLDAARSRAAEEGVVAETVLRDAYPGTVHEQVLAEAASAHADLIVIGTHGRRGVGRWMLGSSAEQIARLAPVPVLLIRAPEAAKAESARFARASGAGGSP